MSFIIPAHNEEDTVEAVVNCCLAAAATLGDLGEVIVVDDASTDRTASRAEVAGARVVQSFARSKSEAVRRGVVAARGSYSCVVDADLLGLSGEQLLQLAAPVLERRTAAAIGVIDYG